MKKTILAMCLCLSLLITCTLAETCPACGGTGTIAPMINPDNKELDFSSAIGDMSINAETQDYGYCIQHTYTGDMEQVRKAAESCLFMLENVYGFEKVYFSADNPFRSHRRYDIGFTCTAHPEYESFSMKITDDYSINSCHVYITYLQDADSDDNYFSLIHSADYVCQEEIRDRQETACEIQWYQMGFSGESFYYGQTDETGEPNGFIVYESNQNSTYYGVNMGGKNKDRWDGTIVTINRDGTDVDSINLITYANGNALHSTCYYDDGSISYCTFDGNTPQVRYDRDGDRVYRRKFYEYSYSWGASFEVPFDEIQPQWGLGYGETVLRWSEEKRENGLHVGTYLLTGVTDEGEKVEILRLITYDNGNVECNLNGASWRYDCEKNTYDSII